MINPRETQGASRRGNKTLKLFIMFELEPRWRETARERKRGQEPYLMFTKKKKKKKEGKIRSEGKRCVNHFSKLRAVVIRRTMSHTKTHTNLAPHNACSRRLFRCRCSFYPTVHGGKSQPHAPPLQHSLSFFLLPSEDIWFLNGSNRRLLESPRVRRPIKAEVVSPPY